MGCGRNSGFRFRRLEGENSRPYGDGPSGGSKFAVGPEFVNSACSSARRSCSLMLSMYDFHNVALSLGVYTFQ